MGQTETPDGLDAHRGYAPVHQGRKSRHVLSMVAGSILCVLGLVLLAGGGWALWKDRVDRDGHGFVSFGTTDLRTEQYAIVGDLRGNGPSWLYGSTVLGDVRVRATSQAEQPLFIGIARKDDVFRYLRGAGYATIHSFEVSADTTHRGAVPSSPPSRESIWATSTEGTGRQTVLWAPQSGDWSIVFMNADASAIVDVRGDAGAELPILPWLAGGSLMIGAAALFIGAWVLARGMRRQNRPAPSEPDESQELTSGGVPVGARG
jgi:hypothetical protein